MPALGDGAIAPTVSSSVMVERSVLPPSVKSSSSDISSGLKTEETLRTVLAIGGDDRVSRGRNLDGATPSRPKGANLSGAGLLAFFIPYDLFIKLVLVGDLIMPIIEYRPQSKVKETSNWLLASGRSVTSQLGQDGILEKIFEIIGTTNKVCIEFGAWDGKFLSNTWNLIENKGWHGVLIEGNSAKFSEISGNHPSGRVTAYNTRVNLSGANSIDNILQTYGELAPDLMSIDIDGNDWHVWSSMDLLKPRVVLIEFNQTIPNDVYFVQDPEFTINQGRILTCSNRAGPQERISACLR